MISPHVERAVNAHKITSAMYDLSTGMVDFAVCLP